MVEKREVKKRGLINDAMGLLVNTLFFLIFSLFFSVLVEFMGLYFDWWSNDFQHSTLMLKDELTYANQTIKDVIIGKKSDSWLSIAFHYFSDSFHFTLYHITSALKQFIPYSSIINSYADAAYNISLVFILRIFLIMFSLPIFAMAFLWGMIDGLVERDLRRFGAGRESSTIFESTKKLIMPFFILPFLIYLSFPSSINPIFIIAPSAIFQCFLYRTLFSKYKKYL